MKKLSGFITEKRVHNILQTLQTNVEIMLAIRSIRIYRGYKILSGE